MVLTETEAGRMTSGVTIIARTVQEETLNRTELAWTWKRWVQVAVFLAWGIVVGQSHGDGWWFFFSFLVLIAQLAYLPRTAPFRRMKPGSVD
ncbi:hypothetical protein ACIPRD_13025 [Streptomyces sp. NPDC090108]|uniref:hypothetical protein n=1 Tax=Streptomyces sp. NPDC090108 TaxID=3365947 RepID=UPI0037F8B568